MMMPSAVEDFFVEFRVIVCRSSTDPTPLVTLLTRIDPLVTRSKGLADQDRLRLT